MNELKQKCTVVRINEAKQVTEKFRLQELVVTIDGEYPQTVVFQASNRNIEKLAELKPGDEIGVTFSLRGRESDSKAAGEPRRVWNTLDVRDVTVTRLPLRNLTQTIPTSRSNRHAQDPNR